jgi:hypothetical protein
MENAPPKKLCTKCNTLKLFSAFRKEPRVKNGLSAACAMCLSEQAKAYYRNTKDLSSKVYTR